MVIGTVVFPVLVWCGLSSAQAGTELELSLAKLVAQDSCEVLRMTVVKRNQSHPADWLCVSYIWNCSLLMTPPLLTIFSCIFLD